MDLRVFHSEIHEILTFNFVDCLQVMRGTETRTTGERRNSERDSAGA